MFEVVDADYSIIDNSEGLGDNIFDRILPNKKKLVHTFAALIDKYAGDERGEIFTIAINTAGYSRDPEQLRSYYNRNKNVLDGYFNQIDLQKLLSAAGTNIDFNQGVQRFVKDNIPAFLIGAGAVIGIGIWLKKRGQR